jgi:hypothetical protein
MPAHHIFKDTPFDQEQIDLMSAVFERVSHELRLSERPDAMRDLVANAILECARQGIFNPFEMRKCVHEVLQLG